MMHAESQKKYKKTEKGRATQSRWYKSATKKEWDAVWRKKNKDKIKAHQAVYLAVKKGKLIKSEECEHSLVSDTECSKNIQAHHPDYSKVLQVVWLCSRHHSLEHIKLKQESEVI